MLITKEKKKLMLDAITAMEQHYLGKCILEPGECPICIACFACSDCMWQRIEGVLCGEMATNMGYKSGVAYLKARRSGRWKKERLEQLPKWRDWVNSQPIKDK